MSHHVITHVDLPAHNTQAAGQFYADLFGWETFRNEEFDYQMFRITPAAGGGFSQTKADSNQYGQQPGQVLIYVSTNDIDATNAKAEELGGKVVTPKMEIPGQGWMSVFVDPTGNHIGLFQWMSAGETASVAGEPAPSSTLP